VGRNLRPTLLEPEGVWLVNLAGLFYVSECTLKPVWLMLAWRLNFEKRD